MKECAHDTNGPDEFAVLRVIPVEDYVDQSVSESGYTGDGWTKDEQDPRSNVRNVRVNSTPEKRPKNRKCI